MINDCKLLLALVFAAMLIACNSGNDTATNDSPGANTKPTAHTKPNANTRPNANMNLTKANVRTVTVLHINDVYRIGGVDNNSRGAMARLRTLRKQLQQKHPDLLLTHAGDFLFPSMLSRAYNGRHMIDVMNQLDGDADAMDHNLIVTFGNHEFDKAKPKDAAIVQSRLNESAFYWLSDNIRWLPDAEGKVITSQRLAHAHIREINGVKVGLFGLTTNLKTPDYAEIDNNYTSLALKISKQLRAQGAQLVIALTHLRMSEDEDIVRTLKEQGPDLILGGHEHNKQSSCLERNKNVRCVIKADADLRTAALVTLTLDSAGDVYTDFEFKALDNSIEQDQTLAKSVARWQSDFSQFFCTQQHAQSDCLDNVLGKTDVTLVGEELEIRRYETTLGNFVVDQALAAFKDNGAQIAFINSGSLRLNQNIPAGSNITEEDLREIFQYPAQLKLVEITGEQLQKIINHSIEDWTGNGWWLQIAGFKYIHNTSAEKATGLQILHNGSYRDVDPDEKILAVTSDYLMDANGDRDGYTMFSVEQEIAVQSPPHLMALTRNAIQTQGVIAPKLGNRICNTQRHRCE